MNPLRHSQPQVPQVQVLGSTATPLGVLFAFAGVAGQKRARDDAVGHPARPTGGPPPPLTNTSVSGCPSSHGQQNYVASGTASPFHGFAYQPRHQPNPAYAPTSHYQHRQQQDWQHPQPGYNHPPRGN